MIKTAGAGPAPIPNAQLNVENLTEAIAFVFSEPAKQAAGEMGKQIRSENGVQRGVESFHRHLPLLNMRYVSFPHCTRSSICDLY